LKQFSQDQPEVDLYSSISTLMEQAGKDCINLFNQRHRDRHIKRCHGDLKLTNLWLPEKKYLTFGTWRLGKRLIALDCVDFNLEFCHIDTLSDVAMLAIDVEAYLKYHLDANDVERLIQCFLECYLNASKEDKNVAWPLLNYYMTEKAIVRASMCILYEDLPQLGEKYLVVAANHASRLEKLLVSEKS
jgi:aminoglycoside phosphotransferase family enzyme